MNHLVLVKHSLPEIVPAVSAERWQLGAVGRRRAQRLADRLAAFVPAIVATSPEPKARETARIVATAHGWPVEVVSDLREHDRRGVEYLSTADFDAAIARCFAAPDQLVFGRETANQARQRFAAAVEGVVATHPDQDLFVVAHGTVIALFVAWCAGVDGYALWRRLGLPSYVLLSRPERELREVVEGVG
jgi:broad specificity phosphatase PhoE